MAQTSGRTSHVLKALRGAQKLPASQAVVSRLGRAAQDVAVSARLNAAQARGDLARSIMARRVGLAEYRIAPSQQYGAAVEFGSGPGGWPSKESISEWIRIKRIHPRVDMTRDEFIYLIRRKIFTKGTPAQPYMRPALEDNRANIKRLLGDGVSAELRRLGLT